jgi:hypothetical protein
MSNNYTLTEHTNIIVVHVLDIDDLIVNIEKLDTNSIGRILIPYNLAFFFKIRSRFPKESGIELGYWGVTPEESRQIEESGEYPDVVCTDKVMDLPPIINVIACNQIDYDLNSDILWAMRLNSVDEHRLVLVDVRYIIQNNISVPLNKLLS